MPLIKKVIKIGDSRAITIPASWLRFLEAKHGRIEAVTMEVNGKLTIRPILKTEK